LADAIRLPKQKDFVKRMNALKMHLNFNVPNGVAMCSAVNRGLNFKILQNYERSKKHS
jgi:hypothetical protein